MSIVDTPEGERMVFAASSMAQMASVRVAISRREGEESLPLLPWNEDANTLISTVAPAEPHAFDAHLIVEAGGRIERTPFRMVEPSTHPH